MSKELIINADDFGVSPDINEGIIRCFKKGVLTDTSMLATAEYFDHAAQLARDNGIRKLGVHLSLTGSFRPVLPVSETGTLVDDKGLLCGHFPELLIKIFLGKTNMDEVRKELKAQILKVRDAGFEITHLDSHEHVHMARPVMRIVLDLMKELGIRYIRVPEERVKIANMLAEPGRGVRFMAIRAACLFSRGLVKKAGVLRNDRFVGHFHAHRLTEQDFYDAIDTAKDGLTEIGCHPGHFGPEISKTRPWYEKCGEELKVICDKNFSKRIDEKQIKLVSY